MTITLLNYIYHLNLIQESSLTLGFSSYYYSLLQITKLLLLFTVTNNNSESLFWLGLQDG